MLNIENISYAYDNLKVLENINITLNKNEIVSIIGGSGVGKTTLFHLISGVLDVKQGSIKVENSVDFRNQISYMLQKDMLLEHKTVIDNITLPLIIQKKSKQVAQQEALLLLKELGLEAFANHYPTQLSGGMRQRVAFLRTYMFKRDILLLDEAFSALDAHTRISMHQWYLKIHRRLNLSTLLITHDIDEAILLSDKIYVLNGKPGKIVLELVIKKPKDYHYDYVTTKQFADYKKQLLTVMGF